MIRLSEQEIGIVAYLKSKSTGKVYWEELAQFTKNPQTVKLKSVKKIISELKRKYALEGQPLPFNVQFETLAAPAPQVNSATAPQMVQIKRTPDGNIVRLDGANANKPPAHIDFVLDFTMKRVKTKNGIFKLNDSEWDVFKYLYSNVGKLVKISELRDKVVYPQYGSKLPARWFDAIMRSICHLRRQVVGLDKRLLTVKGEETSYLFQ